jgi:adenylate cyclase
MTAVNVSDLRDLMHWLSDGGRSAQTAAEFFRQTCERLVAAGVPLWRARVFVHSVFDRSFIWRLGEDVQMEIADFDFPDSAQFVNSPLAIVFQEAREVRYRRDDPDGWCLSLFDDIRSEGVTDYIALPMVFTDGAVHASIWTTKAPGGFTDAQLNALRAIMPPFSRLGEIYALRRTASMLLDTYVGKQAGERILAGQISRGHTESMQAAIWLSDLRGFTALSDRLAPEIVFDILNRYFDCQVPAIRKHGGEILKFMGDGLLAVFPIEEDDRNIPDVCHRVLEAAREARAGVHAMRYASCSAVERFRFGVALHIGSVLFGNIGGGSLFGHIGNRSRLDFTCIGPAVNLAARLEKIAGDLQRTVVASAAFADACACDWADLGEFPIAGLAKAQRVFGLPDEASAEPEATPQVRS